MSIRYEVISADAEFAGKGANVELNDARRVGHVLYPVSF